MANARFLPAAVGDYQDGYDWYLGRSPRAAEKFEAAVEAAAAWAEAFPDAGLPLDAAHRSVPVKKHPYRLVYRVENGTVVVVATPQDKQAPNYWHGR